MAVILYGRAKDGDIDRLNDSASRFIARHGLTIDKGMPGTPVSAALTWHLQCAGHATQRRQWKLCAHRALRHPWATYVFDGYLAAHVANS
jgi:hypothetical protein